MFLRSCFENPFCVRFLGIAIVSLHGLSATETINDNLVVDGNALFRDLDDASNVLSYGHGDRGYRYTFEEGGYNTLIRAYNWHPIFSFDRTNGNPSSPATVNNGELLFDIWVSGMSPDGLNIQKSLMKSLVDGQPSGSTVDQELKFFDGKLSVRSTGNVGINKNQPSAPLDLWAGTQTRYSRFVGDYGKYDFYQTGLHFTSTITNGMSQFYLNDKDNSDSRFLIEALGNGGSRNAFLVTSSGKVGIGTRTPTNALEVNGTIRTKEVIVESSNWPDYVFDVGYELRPLDEVKLHIMKHGYLPEMPSAAEVAENGVSVSETQNALLKKIEELTLYIIHQEERMVKLEEKFSNLSSH